MKKQSFSKFFDRLTRKVDKIEGKKKEKPTPAAPKQIDDNIIVKNIKMKIGWISEDNKSVGLDYLFTYANNVEKIHDDKVKEVIDAQNAARAAREAYAKGYSPKKLKRTDDDDDDDDDNNNKDDSDSESSSDDSDDSEDDDDDDMEEPDEFEVLVRSKKNVTTKFRLFTKTHLLPVVSLYAEFTCVMSPSGTGKYPPTFEDMTIIRVTNTFQNKPKLVSKVLKDIVKVAPWSTVSMRESIAATEIRSSVASKTVLTATGIIFDFIKKKELQKLASILLRDTFRSSEFYWLSCYFQLPATMNDDKAHTLYKDIVSGALFDYAFAKFEQPLDIGVFMKAVAGSQLVALMKEDTEMILTQYSKEHVETEMAKDYEGLLEANRFWVFIRKNIALYQGRLLWHLTGYDVERYQPPVAYSGILYLKSNNLVIPHPVDENIVIPSYSMHHWNALLDICKHVNVVCYEQVSSTIETLKSLFRERIEPDKTSMICATSQSREHALSSCIMNAICADTLQAAQDKWIQDAVSNKRYVILLYEAHLFSIRQMSVCMATILRFLVKLRELKIKAKVHLVMCGVDTEPILNELQTHNAAFRDLLDATSVIIEGHADRINVGSVGTDSIKLTKDVLESAKQETVYYENKKKSLSVIEMATVTPKSADLSQDEITMIVSYINEIIERSSNRRLCFLFENNSHMKQIVSLAEYSSTKCSVFFNSNKLCVGDYVTEIDGGSRQLLDIEIQAMACSTGGPAFGSGHKKVNSVELQLVPSELIYYSVKQGVSKEYKNNPVTVARFACISKCRFSPCPDTDYVGVFTVVDRKYNQSDLNYLNYLANNNIFILTVPKTYGFDTRSVSSKNNMNFFDLAYTLSISNNNNTTTNDQ